MSSSIEKALAALTVFQRKAGQRDVDQAIASLSASLNAALKSFDSNLKNLKDYKIGKKVEKPGESKQAE